ncbi:MAG TPA: hypothetical protein VNS09_25640 [Solirubrobacter sp.]|nr:hypothetical protein [Solirubrobacter sp.]
MERVRLSASAVSAGPDADELIVAFKVCDRMSDVAVSVAESPTAVVLTVEASWEPVREASGGWIPHFCHASAIARLAAPLGTRRVHAAAPGVC